MKGRKKVAIPHLTGGLNNKLNQLIEFAESLNHPVFMDSKGNHLTPNEIVRIYEEAQTASDKQPLEYIYYVPNNEELARRNPAAKMSKKKTNAREKYMANLLGGKNGNDLLNLASKVGSRKAAVELLKSTNTRSPYNVEIPLGEEDEIQALAMQGLTPSNEALVDQAYRNKLENQIVSYLGTKQDLATIDKGAIVTDELISDFRQMLTVYHLAHMMNGPLANSIKGHVPRSKSHVFDRLIPSFDDILAGENLVIFASTIIKKPTSKNTQFKVPNTKGKKSTPTLLPPWLDLAIEDDEALKELKDSLGGRRAEKAIELLASGDFFGFLQQLGTNAANAFETQLRFFFRIRKEVQDSDRQARLFDDLIENITGALVSEFGRGRGYTNRKELAKAVVHATDEAYDRRLTDVFTPLKITVNAARRVRRFSPSGATLKIGMDFQSLEPSETRKGSPMGVISPGMFYIGNYDFQTPPIGWNRKWMVATAQIIHEYWNYIRPSGEATANRAFMPEKGDMSLSLPQILYLIAIRTKELYNYDLAPEEWLILIQVLGGQNALKENYYQTNRDGITDELDDLVKKIEQDLLVQREAVKQAIEDSRNTPARSLSNEEMNRRRRRGTGGARRNPSKSALPQVFARTDKVLSMEKRLETRVDALKKQYKEIRELSQKHLDTVEEARDRHREDKKRLSGVMKSWRKYQDLYEKSEADAKNWKKKANVLQKNVKKLEEARTALLTGSKDEKLTDLVGATLVESLRSNSLEIGIDSLRRVIRKHDIPLPYGETDLKKDYVGLAGKAALHEIVMNYLESAETGDPGAAEVLDTMEDIAIDGDKAIVEDALEELVDDDKSILAAAKEVLEKAEAKKKKRKERKKRKKAEGKSPEEVSTFAEEFEAMKKGRKGDESIITMRAGTDEETEMERELLRSLLDGDEDETIVPPMIDLPAEEETKTESGWLMNYEDRREEENTFVQILKPEGKIGVVFDTHADWKANMEIIEHMESNHGELNHVLWAGDCFDAGRGSLTYTPGEDDIKNWKFIQSLIERDEDKYIFLSGNHEQPELASFGGSFWKWAKENGVYDDYTQETANLPFMARAGPVMICHGGFPVPVLIDPPKPKHRFWNDPGVWTKTVQLHTIWTRPSAGPAWNMTAKRKDAGEEFSEITGTMLKKAGEIYFEPKTEDEWREFTEDLNNQYSLNEEFEFAMARFGINTMITAHTPSINYGVIGKPAYESESFLHISGQSARDITRKPIYAIVDFDTQEITIEIADAGVIAPYPLDDSITALTWVETAKEKLPKMILDTEGIPKEYKYKRNPPGEYHEYEEDVIDVLIDEGGAAGLSALRPAFPPKTTKTQARNMLKQMNSVVLHKEGDYILVRGISNPVDYAVRAEESIKGTKIQTSPGPKGENCGSCIYMCPTSGRCSKWSEKAGWPVFVLEDWYCKAYEAGPKRNVPFDTTELYKKIKEDDKRAALRELKLFGEDYIDDELQLRMKHYERSNKYEIVYSEQSRAFKALARVFNSLFGRPIDDLAFLDDTKLFNDGKKFIETELKKLYNAKAVELDWDRSAFVPESVIELTFTMKERRKRKNPQLPACSYRKSKRAKACGGKLRAKKNPKGRIVCTKCDAEYEMR